MPEQKPIAKAVANSHFTPIRRLLAVVMLCSSANTESAVSEPALAEELAYIEDITEFNQDQAKAAIRDLRERAIVQKLAAVQAKLAGLECALIVTQSPPDAAALAERALPQAEIDPEAQVLLHNCLGLALEYTGELEAAAAQYAAALAQARAAKLVLREVESLGFVADLASYQGELVLAAGQIRDAMNLITTAKSQLPLKVQANPDDLRVRAINRTHRALLAKAANVYFRLDDREKALATFQELLDEAIALGNVPSQINGYYNIGRALEESGRYEEAWKAQMVSLKLAEETNDKTSQEWSHRSLGAILVLQEKYEQAEPHIDRAMAAFLAMGDTEMVAQLQFYQAKILRHQNKLAEAIGVLDAAIATFRTSSNLRFLNWALWDMALLKQNRGAIDDAFRLALERENIHQQLDKQIQDRAAARLQASFDFEKQENENRRLQDLEKWQTQQLQVAAKLSSQQYIILLLIVILGGVVASYAYRQFRVARHMRAVAMTDELTRVPNRRAIYKQAEHNWQIENIGVSLLMLDIDFFKKINDGYGHATGDAVLQRVAQLCRDQLRQGDVIGRVGGEEFMVLLPGAPLNVATEVAERLRVAVAALNLNDIAKGLVVTISIGVASRLPTDGKLGDAIARADGALYEAKQTGRNRVVVAAASPSG